MDRRILLVSAHQSFVVSAMIKNLTGESYEVIYSAPNVEEIAGIENSPHIIVLYLDEDMDSVRDYLQYIRGVLANSRDQLAVYLVGGDNELDAAMEILPGDFTRGVFHRPLNVKELAEKLEEVTGSDDQAERRKHILVVDDDGTMLRTLKLWLSDRFQVYMANSGANAITLLKQKKVDLILLDYEMPIASGPEVLKMIRSEPSTRDIPVMFLTARNDRESFKSAMELKPEKYLLKTMPPDVLLDSISEFFMNKS